MYGFSLVCGLHANVIIPYIHIWINIYIYMSMEFHPCAVCWQMLLHNRYTYI